MSHGDAVYLVGPQDTDELRYSLRSLAAHVDHGQVWIAGECPDWVADAWHIDIPQTRAPRLNARDNLLAAINEPSLSDPFMLWCDDFYATIHVGELPVLNSGSLAEAIDRAGTGDYGKALAKTYRHLRNEGHPTPLAYDALHVPQWFHKEPLAEVLASGTPMYATAYGNLHRAHPGTTIPNAKARDGWRERTWVSTNSDTWTSEAGEYIRSLFPDPCRYEAG